MFVAIDSRGVVLSANQICAAELGYAVPELVGQPIWRFYPPEDRALPDAARAGASPIRASIQRWEARKVRRDGSELWVRETARAVVGRPRQPSVLVVSEDITESRRRSEQLAYHANHDALDRSGQPKGVRRAARARARRGAAEKMEHALCYFDLDQFKVINDSCGHVAGDEFLRQLGRALQGVVSKRDTLARLGGDEFGVLLERCQVEQAQRVAHAVLDAIDNLSLTWEAAAFGSASASAWSRSTSTCENVVEPAARRRRRLLRRQEGRAQPDPRL